jgi:serine/threonine protein kinase
VYPTLQNPVTTGTSFQPGQHIGRYQVVRLLGEGPLCQVYAVHDPDLLRDAALKIAFRVTRHDSDSRLTDEARLLSSLRHSGVVDIWDAGSHEGREYFVMERLDHALSDEFDGGLLKLERCVYWLHGTALALDHLHRRGVLHLDIRAETVFLDSLGEVRLTDFGFANASGTTLAPPERNLVAMRGVAPPELLANGAVGTFTDVWALGALMYQLFAGRPPLEGPPRFEPIIEVASSVGTKLHAWRPPSSSRPDLPAALDALCLSCLAPEVDQRECDAGAVARRLKPWQGGTPGSRIFISHAEADRQRVERDVIAPLESHGFRTWYCRDDVRSASLWERAILDALEGSDWFLVVMSPASMQSEWVKDEVHWAIDHRPGRILPVMINRCDPAGFHIRLRRLQIIDLNDGRGPEKMLSALAPREHS